MSARPSSRLLPRPATLLLGVLLLSLIPALLAPLYELMQRSLASKDGDFVGWQNFLTFADTPGLAAALGHTLLVGTTVTALTLTLGFGIAYGLTHTRMPGRRLCAALALLPLFVPSLLPAIGLIYLFGEQGILRGALLGHSLYGPLGIVLGCTLFALPHAVLLLRTSLQGIDARQYAAAASLGAGAWRRFCTITLPNARYGLISAAVAVFVLTITDFGVPKVVGGQYAMLATEIYTQVIGQQNFPMGAVASLMLLLPTVLAMGLDRWARAGQKKLRAAPRRPEPAPHALRDSVFGLGCWIILAVVCGAIATVLWASFMAFWPYDLTPSLENYDFASMGYSLKPLGTSVLVALATAATGCLCLISGAYVLERRTASPLCKGLYRCCVLLPLGIPGTTLGLAYIFAFNAPGTPWAFLYGTPALLVMNCVVHFCAVSHMTAVGALGKLDRNYEAVGCSMGVPVWRTFLAVIAPLCRAPFADMAFYLFINAMTTVSAVIFLCGPQTTLASVSLVNMYDSGNMGGAAALGSLMLGITLAAAGLHALLRKGR